MPQCEKCGLAVPNTFDFVTIRTLLVRDSSASKRYHAMGKVFSLALCPDCITAHIESRKKPGKQFIKALLLPGLMALVATAAPFLPIGEVKWLFPAVFGVFSIVLFIAEFRRIRCESHAIRTGTGAFTRPHMIEELAAALLPPKHQDAYLTYILRDRVIDQSQIPLLAEEYRISQKKLEAIRSYMLSHSEEDMNQLFQQSNA